MSISAENHPQQCDSVHRFISLPSIQVEQSFSEHKNDDKLFSINVSIKVMTFLIHYKPLLIGWGNSAFPLPFKDCVKSEFLYSTELSMLNEMFRKEYVKNWIKG